MKTVNIEIKSLFVPYEEALALEELGFDEYCFATVDQIDYVHIKGTKSSPRGSMVFDTISCPTFSQVFKWFRDNHIEVSEFIPHNRRVKYDA